MRIPDTNGIFAAHYLLKERLGSRSIAEVWKAEDWTAEGAIVAIKIFTPHVRLDHHSLEQLRKEQEVFALLEHPGLLRPYKFDIYEGIPYLVMPYMAQGSLSQRLLAKRALSEQQLALLIAQIGGALHYLHSFQPPLLHHHLTPDNIFISDKGDFLLSPPEVSSQLRNLMYKASGKKYAPVTAYAAPELFSTHPVYHAESDVFSLGVLLYESCTGQVPWLGNGGQSLLRGAEVPYVAAPYSRTLSNLIRSCLNPAWDKRPSAETLTDEAEYFLKYGKWKSYGQFGDVTAESIVYRKKSPLLPVLLATLLVLAAVAAAYFFYFKDRPDLFGGSVTAEQAADAQQATTRTDSVKQGRDTVPEAKQTAAAPVPPKRQQNKPKPETEAVSSRPQKAVSASPPPQPSYPRPTNLEGYLNGLLNEEVPLNVKDQWRPAIRKYFTSDAIIYTQANNKPLGSFGVSEFLDILLATQTGSIIQIDNIIYNDDDKVEEIFVNISSEE